MGNSQWLWTSQLLSKFFVSCNEFVLAFRPLIAPLVRLGINVAIFQLATVLRYDETTLMQSICSTSNSDAVVSGFSVNCLGHSWPSTLGLHGGFTDFNAATDILPFFEVNTLT
jgi:hypothetical protein